MPFSGTRLNDDLRGVACAGYFTVPIKRCRPIPRSCSPEKGGRCVGLCPPILPAPQTLYHVAIQFVELPAGIPRPEIVPPGAKRGIQFRDNLLHILPALPLTGELSYSVPEFLRRLGARPPLHHAVDRRADIWAFGAVRYEMLTDQRPVAFDGLGNEKSGSRRLVVTPGSRPGRPDRKLVILIVLNILVSELLEDSVFLPCRVGGPNRLIHFAILSVIRLRGTKRIVALPDCKVSGKAL